ncbi:glycine betaine/L-proline ABC transporter ATP-binding protein [uncultured Paracoccus sp.]|uniref:quaternary amine ABC transporter ATP-binding protein n=1 Tax=uncultured Paracoccus sp. TaxID=189685 RepID=UPI00261E1525|nr:glycine betaine/L-proline ABC transporter ATP-binding protein [uncultured Paracoccus sp.]
MVESRLQSRGEGSDIEIRNLYKIFGPNAAAHVDAVRNGLGKDELNAAHGHVLGLNDINLTIPSGRITVVMGLSGSGKSTLIRHINRLIDPTAGEILYEGQDIARMSQAQLLEFRRSKTAMVFQKFALMPHRTVMQNVGYGLGIRGVAEARRNEIARHWISRVGLDGFEDRYPNQLSGGMQQRVGLARALANDAEILLMDEAFSALDPLIRMEMQGILLDLQQELHKTIVFITHDLDEALRLGDKVAILRDGQLIQQGTGESIVLRPRDGYIADFVREVSRGKVIHVGTIMRRGAPVDTPVALPRTATLDEAARALTNADINRANVVDDTGRHLGVVTLAKIVAEMIAPDDSEPLEDDAVAA